MAEPTLSELADELSEDQRYCRCIRDGSDCASCRAIIALRSADDEIVEYRRRLTIMRDDARISFGLGLMPWLLDDGKASDTAAQLANILSGWHEQKRRADKADADIGRLKDEREGLTAAARMNAKTALKAGERTDEAEVALAEMRSALERAKQYLYNGFEPDNQSSAYHDICGALGEEITKK